MCIQETGMNYNRQRCSLECPDVISNETSPLSFYRAQVDVESSEEATIFTDLTLEYNAMIGRNVSQNESVLHYPVDIYDRGML